MSDGDCVRVAIRIRPLVKSEIDRGCQNVIEKIPSVPQVVVKNNDAFTFNYVFSQNDTQQSVYETAVAGMLDKLFKGYNVTILAYGQTGSGKTHTMGTAFNGSFDSGMGVIPRAVSEIFEKISSLPSEKNVTICCSFVELYQEQLYDLLSTNSREQTVVDIREDGNRGIVIPGLTEKPVTSAKETTDCLMKGSAGRAVGATAMNSQSSRSHAIFTITIQLADSTDSNNSTTAKFHLVDLAGSERAQKTKATGDRFREGVKINQGLLALGNVISALGSGQNNGYVGYRDSKLTRLLQDSLGGNSVTLMIACVSPADYNMDETLSTLRYADRARKIKNKPIVNQDPKTAEITRLNGIIQKLRMELLSNGGSSSNDSLSTPSADVAVLRKNLENYIEKNRNLQQQLQVTLHEVSEVEMRAICAETTNDELQQKLLGAKDLVNSLNENLNEKSSPAELVDHSQKIKELRTFFSDIDSIFEKNKEQLLDHKKSFSLSNGNLSEHIESLNATEAMQQRLEAFNNKQLDCRNEIRRIERELSLKEELQQRVAGNLSKFCLYEGDNNVESKMKEYESQIEILEAEKTDLCGKLKCLKGNASAKIAEERRLRLQQLEQQINELRKKNLQQSKLLKMREKESQKIANLSNEIQAMKSAKIKLIRSMRAESENFRQWKLNREKELTQLKEKDRKRQNEMIRMESLHNKQRNVLKRKVEEAMAINKRLKDALEKQKSAQHQRRNVNSGKVEHVLSWIDQELEIILSVIDAEYSLEQLMEDRAVINNRLQEIKDTNPDNTQEINSIEEELQMRNAQINDLQQKVIASDIETKIKAICDGLQSMPEARAALKHLFTTITGLQRENAGKEVKIEEMKSVCESADENAANLEREINVNEHRYREELSNMEKAYEEKITVLLRELSNVPQPKDGEITPEMDERIKIQQETLDKLDSLREELENYKSMCNELQHRLDEKSLKKPRNKKALQEVNEDIEIILDDSIDEEGINDNWDKDPDWRKTPVIRRRNTQNSSREDKSKPLKRSSDGSIRCSCKGNCLTKRCLCCKNEAKCSENCKCTIACNNKYTNENEIEDEDEVEVDETKVDIKEEDIPTDIEEQTPKKAKLSVENESTLDITTPLYPYSIKKRKPFFD